MKKTIAISALIAVGLAVAWQMTKSNSEANEVAAAEQATANVEENQTANSKEEKSKKEIIYNVEFFEVESKTLRTFVTSSSTLKADRQVDIYSKKSGQIQKLTVEEGMHVKAGQVLLVLDGEEQELELQQMAVNLSKAKAEFQRIEKSYKNQLISAEEFENKKFELERSVAEHEKVAHQVALTKVKAPFSGTITKRVVEMGQTIQPSEVLFTLAALDPLEAEVYLTESQVAGLKVKQQADFAKEDDFENAFSGFVKQISPIVDRETGTVKVTMAVPNAPQGVRPGTYVQLRVETTKSLQPTVVPKRALTFDSRQQAYAFVAKAHETREGIFEVSKTAVELGVEEGEWVSITSGLDQGAAVVLTGKESLKTGSFVRDTNETATQEIARL